MLSTMIRNYWERNGSFDNITNTYIGDEIQKMATEKNMSVEDFCFSTMGYDADSVSPAKLFWCKVYALDTDQERFHQLNPSLDIEQFRKKWGITKIPKAVTDSEDPEVELLISVMIDYLSQDELTLPVYFEGLGTSYTFPFRNWLQEKNTVSEVLKSDDFKKVLPEIYENANVSEATVIGHTLCLPGKLIIKADDLLKKVISRMMYARTPYHKLWKLTPSNMAVFYWIDRRAYFRALEYAAYQGKTYAEVCRGFGYIIPDYIRLYEQSGMIFFTSGDRSFIYNHKKKDWDMIEGKMVPQVAGSSVFSDENGNMWHKKENTDEIRCF